MSIQIDSLAYTNRLRFLPPQHKLLFALTTLVIALVAHPPTQVLIACYMTLWTVGYAGINVKVYLQLLLVVELFLLMSLPPLILDIVSLPQVPLIQGDCWQGILVGNWYICINYQGLQQVFHIAGRSLACVCCLLFILCTIPFTDLLHTLRQLKVPTLMTDLLLLMYRFVFLLLQTAGELSLAQRARGGYRNPLRWFYSLGMLVGQLLWRSLQHYQEFSLGLTTRGFKGEFQVYSGRHYTYSRRYALESCIACGGLILLEIQLFI